MKPLIPGPAEFPTTIRKVFIFLLLPTFLCIFRAMPVLAQERVDIEERMLRMEKELRELRQFNEELQRELRELRQKLESRQPAQPEIEEQAPAETAAAVVETEEIPPLFNVGYDRGFFIASADGMFALRLGGRITTRFTAFDENYPLNDEFSIERARLETDVNLLEYYALRVQVEFSDSPKLKDGYIDVHYIPQARLRIGQYKVPFSWEALQSHKYLDFADLSLAVSNMRASRDIGAMLHGLLWEDRLQYQFTVINGSGENTGDNNDAKDIAGRVAALPFLRTDNALLSPLLLGISATFGDQNTDFSSQSFKTPLGGTEFVDFAPDTILKGNRTRLGTEFVWPIGPASIKSEWMRMWFDNFQRPPVSEDIRFDAWYVSGTYLLTGERKTLGRIIPRKPFDPYKHTWGAWEVAARYSVFKSDDDLFESGLATGTDEAEAFTIGLNWYLNPFMRVIFDYEHTEFEDEFVFEDQTVDDEDVFAVQCQLEF